MKKRLWRISGPIEVGNLEMLARRFVDKESQLYIRAYSRDQAVWMFADRFADMENLDHHQVYIGDAEVYEVEPPEEKDGSKEKREKGLKGDGQLKLDF